MKITSVSFLNIKDCYRLISEVYLESGNTGKTCGENLPYFMNNFGITFQITEITKYEYTILKMISSDISNFIPVNDDIKDELIKRYFKEVYNSYKNYSLKIDSKLHNFYEPCGFQFGSCIVKFYGNNLIGLMNGNPIKFFIDITNNKCVLSNDNLNDHTVYLNPEYTDNLFDDLEYTQNQCIKILINYIYKNIQNNLTKIDYMSDSISYSLFNKYIPSPKSSTPIDHYRNFCHLVNIRDYGMDINYMRDTSDEILSNLKINKKIRGDGIYRNNKLDLTSIKMQFLISSDLNTFMDLINILPINKFLYMESLVIPNKILRSDAYTIVSDVRLVNSLQSFLNNIDSEYANKENFIKLNQMTLGLSRYRYSIQLSLDDVDLYISDYLNDNLINNRNLGGICNAIINNSRNIFNMVK